MRRALLRLLYPHGLRCVWFCPPWHQNPPPWDDRFADPDGVGIDDYLGRSQ